MDVLMLLGSTICHQLPERSYSFDGVQMPLCARCIGIHFGFLLSTLFLFTGSRRFAGGLPSVRQAIGLAAIMAFFLIDAGLSYSGLSESDNLRRTLSGLSLGVPFPFLVFPFLNSILYPGRNPSNPLSKKSGWAWLAVIYCIAAAAILASGSVGAMFYAVSSAGIIGLFLFMGSAFFLVLVLGLEDWHAKPWHKASLAAAVACVFLASLAVIQTIVPGPT